MYKNICGINIIWGIWDIYTNICVMCGACIIMAQSTPRFFFFSLFSRLNVKDWAAPNWYIRNNLEHIDHAPKTFQTYRKDPWAQQICRTPFDSCPIVPMTPRKREPIIRVFRYIHTCTYVRTYMCVCVRMCAYETVIYTYICVFTYVHIHVYTCGKCRQRDENNAVFRLDTYAQIRVLRYGYTGASIQNTQVPSCWAWNWLRGCCWQAPQRTRPSLVDWPRAPANSIRVQLGEHSDNLNSAHTNSLGCQFAPCTRATTWKSTLNVGPTSP